MSQDSMVNRHYGQEGIAERILNGLRQAGKDPDNLTYTDLAPVDQFHSGGRNTTLELAQMAGIGEDDAVLDVGGGVGGPARILAAERGCHVTVLDLTEEFCQVGEMLTARTGLDRHVQFKVGDALDLPFEDAQFDVGWTQHSSMNIPDKAALYRAIGRVLRPGGRLAIHEVMAGPVQPIHFPVHWASHEGMSWLRAPDAMRAAITDAGFREIAWVDKTQAALAGFQQAQAMSSAGQLPPLGLHLLLGPAFGPALDNITRNLAEQRLAVIMAVFEKI